MPCSCYISGAIPRLQKEYFVVFVKNAKITEMKAKTPENIYLNCAPESHK